MVFPVMVEEWPLIAATLLVAVLVGKALRQETRVLMASLIGAVATDSYGGVLLAVFVCLVAAGFDLVRKVV